MITVFCALYCEAEALIAHYQLKKDSSNAQFQVFADAGQTLRVVITGVGGIAAATAVGSICTGYGIGKGDMLLNIGTCAGVCESAEGIFLGNKLVEEATGRTFYPDMLYRHAFPEAAIVTGSRPLGKPEEAERDFAMQRKSSACALQNEARDSASQQPGKNGGIAQTEEILLYDMEAAAIYQAGNHFVGPHRMQFIKIVSDHGIGQGESEISGAHAQENLQSGAQSSCAQQPSPKQISRLVEQYADTIFSYIDRMSKCLQNETKDNENLSEEMKKWLEKLSMDMHCSKVMQDELRQQLKYQELTGGDCASVFRSMYEENLLPCKDKREGKKRFEELKQRLL